MSTSYQDIDSELSSLAEAARRLRSQRNTLALPCRLPTEILAMIFLWIIDLGNIAEPRKFNSPRIKDWYRILHVCTRWREVALDCPLLWSRVDVTSPLWTPEMLKLSKRALLSLRVEGYSTASRISEASKLVLQHSDRLRVLHLSGFRDYLTASTEGVTNAANLRSLILRHCHWRADIDVFEVPREFLGAGVPRLERLELRKCKLHWDSPIFLSCPGLKTLTIEGVHKDKPTFTQLQHALENMPLLRHLHLEHILPEREPIPTNAPPLFIPLRTLYISGTMSECAYFFRRISVPSCAAVAVRCRQPKDIADVIEFVSALFQARQVDGSVENSNSKRHQPLSSWSLDFDPISLLLHGTTTTSSMGDGVPRSKNSLSLKIQYCTMSKGETSIWSVVKTLLQELPITLDATKSLRVCDDTEFMDCARWTYLLQHMPNLSTLRTTCTAPLHLPSALGVGTHAGHDDSLEELRLLPSLDVLELYKVDMSRSLESESTPFLHALQDLQVARSNHVKPFPISKLHLSECRNIGHREVRTLQRLFVEVDWDGYESHVPQRSSCYSEYVDSEGNWFPSRYAEGWEDWNTL